MHYWDIGDGHESARLCPREFGAIYWHRLIYAESILCHEQIDTMHYWDTGDGHESTRLSYREVFLVLVVNCPDVSPWDTWEVLRIHCHATNTKVVSVQCHSRSWDWAGCWHFITCYVYGLYFASSINVCRGALTLLCCHLGSSSKCEAFSFSLFYQNVFLHFDFNKNFMWKN